MQKKCFYNTKSCTNKITREHTVSNSVLKTAFGEKNENITTLPNGKNLIDHESVIKDVCSDCNNNKLTKYDVAGVSLLKYLIENTNTNDIIFNTDIFCWILKTHFNELRAIKDSETDQTYEISQYLKDFITFDKKDYSILKDIRLFTIIWNDDFNNWEKESVCNISFFEYKSIRMKKQNIILSIMRFRQLSTVILLPYDLNLEDLDKRFESAINELKEMEETKELIESTNKDLIELCNFNLFTEINIENALINNILSISNIFPQNKIDRIFPNSKKITIKY